MLGGTSTVSLYDPMINGTAIPSPSGWYLGYNYCGWFDTTTQRARVLNGFASIGSIQGGSKRRIGEIYDGLSNTIAVVSNSVSIAWPQGGESTPGVHPDGRMQAGGRLPGAVAHAGGEFAHAASGLQGHFFTIAQQAEAIGIPSGYMGFQTFQRRVHKTHGAAG